MKPIISVLALVLCLGSATSGLGGEKAQAKPNILRGLSYMVLLIAAVFVIHAMTKSCCRASWTTVVFIAALGFGLLAYTFYHKSRERY